MIEKTTSLQAAEKGFVNVSHVVFRHILECKALAKISSLWREADDEAVVQVAYKRESAKSEHDDRRAESHGCSLSSWVNCATLLRRGERRLFLVIVEIDKEYALF